MIVVPPGWSVEPQRYGLDVVHPGGREIAVIEYRERVRPLRKLGALLHDALARGPACAWPDRVERLVTDEGEHAALATLRGDGVQRDLGFVFGDDFYARIAGMCRRPDRFEEVTRLVRELVTTDTQMLGVRRRRFEYAPPAGWQALARGFVTDWLAPGYPRDPVWMTIFPALPVEQAPAELLASMLAPRDHAELVDDQIAPLCLPNGLAGDVGEAVWASPERRVAKVCCVLRDRRYAYPLEASAEGEDRMRGHREVIDRVLASVQPVPPANAPVTQATPSFWVE
jgi:hypothetical protein